jgi:hypothetical protein
MLLGCVYCPSMLAAEAIVVHFFPHVLKLITQSTHGGGKFKHAYVLVGVSGRVKLRKAASEHKFMRPYVE